MTKGKKEEEKAQKKIDFFLGNNYKLPFVEEKLF